jgi:hypothetical protein
MAFFLIIVFFSLTLLSSARHRFGNYFYPPEIYQVAERLRQIEGREIYLYAASDLLYPLSNKLPPNGYYLPSLPWYLNYQPFQEKLLRVLDNSRPLILVDPYFSVDNQKLIDSTPAIIKFIDDKYLPVEKIGHYVLYQPK